MAKFSLRKVNKDLKPLSGLYSEEELATISKFGTIVDIAPGQALFEEGQLGAEVAIIVAGQAKITKGGVVRGHLHTGDVVGEASVLNRAPRAASVHAVTILRIAVLDVDAFAQALNNSQVFRQRIDETMQKRAA